jgi:hypothetical protein
MFPIFFGAVVMRVFAGGFAENRCLVVVFCWCDRGGMRGKRGVLDVPFVVLKDAPGF